MSYQDNAFTHLERVERNYHLFKAVLIITMTISLFLFIAYEGNKTIDNVNAKNLRVEQLLRCSLPAFTPQHYPQAEKIINKCLENNR